LRYRKQIDNLLRPEDIVIDFNSNEYDYIRSKYSTYSDGSHLSSEGGRQIIEVLNNTIEKFIVGND